MESQELVQIPGPAARETSPEAKAAQAASPKQARGDHPDLKNAGSQMLKIAIRIPEAHFNADIAARMQYQVSP